MAWQTAKRRAAVIRPLAAMPRCSHALVRAAAAELELSVRQVYTLIKRCLHAVAADDRTVSFWLMRFFNVFITVGTNLRRPEETPLASEPPHMTSWLGSSSDKV